MNELLHEHMWQCFINTIFGLSIRIHFAFVHVPQIETEMSNSEGNLKDAMDRLGTLGREINALKTKRANNSMAAARAEETATMARDKANEAKQVCGCVCVCVNFASLKVYNTKPFSRVDCSDSRWPADW